MHAERTASLVERVVAKAEALAPGESLRIPYIFANGITFGRSARGRFFYADGCNGFTFTRRRGEPFQLLRDALIEALAVRNMWDAALYRREIEAAAHA